MGSSISKVLHKNENVFKIEHFKEITLTRPYKNLKTFFVYFENWVGNL